MEQVCERFDFVIHAFCQMGNHYHLLVETPEGNLGAGMRQLNSVYAQYFNRRHRFDGHVLQGRYKAILVDQDQYLLELSRYIVLNPLRAGMVKTLDDWEWSSHPSMMGRWDAPTWLESAALLARFGDPPARARVHYEQFVLAGVGKDSPLVQVRHQCLLGDEAFVQRHGRKGSGATDPELSRRQRRALALSLEEYASIGPTPAIAMANAYRTTAYTMPEIAAHFDVSTKTVARAVAAGEGKGGLSE